MMSYLKVTAVAYIAFLLMLLSFFLHVDRQDKYLESQLTLLSVALFVTVMNMRSNSSALGTRDTLSLVDTVHILTLIEILFGAGSQWLSSYCCPKG